ncbi:MAG TPA: glucose-1-phosphate adenylyltransferase [Thermoanaerobaculia bacterium]|jgi:glucose-1-phosphate adenylyltransferase|nr:glucose-1-phosphate adenylyltransferase [Thermoanaerobaculia bacterium]
MAMEKVVTAILGGGQGTRLWPLTRDRAKPAVPVGGKFRLIDIPISNSLHAGIDRIFVITQFNSASLHRHIAQTYRFSAFSLGFVNILAAEQTMERREWYQGTADAVRQTLPRLLEADPPEVLILSGDQLYLMNISQFVKAHRDRDADITIAVKPVTREEASAFGILRLDPSGRIVEFVEKPKEAAQLDAIALDEQTQSALGFPAPPGSYLASMGIYIFRPEVLRELLVGTTAVDFGREVIPQALENYKVYAFPHNGYWTDIGTIPSFHQANLDLTLPLPPLNLYDPDLRIYTHPRFLPGTKVTECFVQCSILSEGSILSGSRVTDSIVGVRAVVRSGSVIERSVVMGTSSWETLPPGSDQIPIGIGMDCHIKNAIIDFDTRIGDGSKLINADGVQHADADNYCIRDGIIVVPKGAVIPPGTVI